MLSSERELLLALRRRVAGTEHPRPPATGDAELDALDARLARAAKLLRPHRGDNGSLDVERARNVIFALRHRIAELEKP